MANDYDPYAPQDPYIIEAKDVAPVVMDGTVETPGDPDAVESMPKGSTSDVLEWVGDDKARAKTALDTEKGHSNPRKGLVNELEEILGK